MSHSRFLRKEDSELLVGLSVKVSFQSQGAYNWMYFFLDCEWSRIFYAKFLTRTKKMRSFNLENFYFAPNKTNVKADGETVIF